MNAAGRVRRAPRSPTNRASATSRPPWRREGSSRSPPVSTTSSALHNDDGTRAFGVLAAAEVDRDLRALTTGSPSLGVTPGEIDFGHIVLLGHSRGAALAAILGRRTGAPRLSRPVSGLVQLAPSVGSVDSTLLADLPAAVVIGTCDGDTGVDGGRFVAPSLDRARRTTPVGLVMIDHATHDATNDRLALEAPPPGRPGCGATQRLEPVAQRQLLMALVPEVARATLGATSSGASATIFDRLRADDQVQPGVRIVHVDPTTVRTSLLPKLGQLVPTAGFTPQWCPGGRYAPFRAPGTEPCHRLELEDLVGWPSGLELTWFNPSAALTVPVPASASPEAESRALFGVPVDLADRRVDIDHQRPQRIRPCPARPGPAERFAVHRVELADVAERMGTKECAERRRGHHDMTQNRAR